MNEEREAEGLRKTVHFHFSDCFQKVYIGVIFRSSHKGLPVYVVCTQRTNNKSAYFKGNIRENVAHPNSLSSFSLLLMCIFYSIKCL